MQNLEEMRSNGFGEGAFTWGSSTEQFKHETSPVSRPTGHIPSCRMGPLVLSDTRGKKLYNHPSAPHPLSAQGRASSQENLVDNYLCAQNSGHARIFLASNRNGMIPPPSKDNAGPNRDRPPNGSTATSIPRVPAAHRFLQLGGEVLPELPR